MTYVFKKRKKERPTKHILTNKKEESNFILVDKDVYNTCKDGGSTLEHINFFFVK